MKFTQQIIDDIEMLSRFKLSTMQEGIKVHHDAAAPIKQAANRLHTKGLITQQDGGYLTHAGIEAAEHAEKVFSILSEGLVQG